MGLASSLHPRLTCRLGLGKPMPPMEPGAGQDPMVEVASPGLSQGQSGSGDTSQHPRHPRARTHSSSVSVSRFSIFLIWLS